MPLSTSSILLAGALALDTNTTLLNQKCYQPLGPYHRIAVSCENVRSILEIVKQPTEKKTYYQDKLQYDIYYDGNGTPVIMIEKPETIDI